MAITPRFHKIEKQGPIMIMRFDNPPKNLASMDTMMEYIGLLAELESDPELRVGIITSATPGKFIQHFDVSSILDWSDEMNARKGEEAVLPVADAEEPTTISDITSKPVICCINGPVEGGGCELAIHCDFRFMSRDAFMGQPEVNAGFPPGYGIPRLVQLVGLHKTLELCMTGRRVFADEAKRIGLITRACDPDKLETEVMEFAVNLALKPPMALATIKKTAYGACDLTLKEALALNREMFGQAIMSEDAVRIMKLYVASGQDAEKLAEAVMAAGGDQDKALEILTGK